MAVSIEQLSTGLVEVFPESARMEFTAETTLGELPEWDSMAAVNFQTWLLKDFDIEVPLEMLADETRLEEIIAFLDEAVNNVAV